VGEIPFAGSADGTMMDFSYDSVTHILTISSGTPAPVPTRHDVPSRLDCLGSQDSGGRSRSKVLYRTAVRDMNISARCKRYIESTFRNWRSCEIEASANGCFSFLLLTVPCCQIPMPTPCSSHFPIMIIMA